MSVEFCQLAGCWWKLWVVDWQISVLAVF